eukprot:TRINITY_DN71405_c0_g1_i1.p1 TRINITY_DN71405_c0_g1~~TRINITY_DN71405_c0_g1_i1.p1  ORF type:complete len:397 (+),score=88.23 TRINITY_DN71405_c0_g1_i1:71-1192(+)
MAAAEDRYVFHMEWFDAQADLVRRYLLSFYPRDNSIEMYDPKLRRAFLKRMPEESISLKNIYIGSVITVHGRQLRCIDYADEYTKNAMETKKNRTLALVKPDAYNSIGVVLNAIQVAGFVVARLRMVRMDAHQARTFCSMQPDGAGPEDEAHLAADVSVAVEIVGDDAVAKWKAIVGPADPADARRERPRSLRAQLASDRVRNAVHASADEMTAEREIEFFFGQPWPTTAIFQNCTLCVVRPHAFPNAGEIVSGILSAGFEISAMGVWYMDRATAEEFLEVYKGVMPEYHDICAQLCTGPSLVMEVRQENAVDSFRQFCGPHDPEVAKHLRPNTLRAKFGSDRVLNAVHCTDLEEDGLLEVEYFFSILHDRDS